MTPTEKGSLRLDQRLVELGLVTSRNQAQGRILAGDVKVNDIVITKVGYKTKSDDRIDLAGTAEFVSRAGGKLKAALQHFKIIVTDRVIVDCGISTGGFTDCLLQQGAKHVYGIDVGYGDVAWKIRQSQKVTLIERTNFRTLFENQEALAVLEEAIDEIDMVTLDLSFISLTKVADTVTRLLSKGGDLVALVKPQFEVGRDAIGKGGIVKDQDVREAAVEKVTACYQGLGFDVLGTLPSPVIGAKGNQEYLLAAQKRF